MWWRFEVKSISLDHLKTQSLSLLCCLDFSLYFQASCQRSSTCIHTWELHSATTACRCWTLGIFTGAVDTSVHQASSKLVLNHKRRAADRARRRCAAVNSYVCSRAAVSSCFEHITQHF